MTEKDHTLATHGPAFGCLANQAPELHCSGIAVTAQLIVNF